MPYVVLGGAQLAVAAAAIFARYALAGAGPLAVSAARLTIAALVLLVLAAVRRSSTTVQPRENRLLALGGVALAIHFAGWIWSLEYATVAVSTLLVTTTPVWTAIFDTAFGKRRLSRRAAFAFATGGIGLVMVVAWNRTPPPVAGHAVAGAALALLGSVAMAAYLLIVREVRKRLPQTRPIVTRTYAWAAAALVLAALVARQPPPPLPATAAWGGIFAMALISQLIGHTALNASLRWFSPSAISFATLLEPVFAAILAYLLFSEGIAPVAAAGAAILLVAIGIVLREEREAIEPAL